MRPAAAALAFAGLVCLAPVAAAAPAPKKPPPPPNSVLPMGRSVGSPTEGHLAGGAHLDDAPYLRIVPAYASGDVRWGLGALVGLLDRSARGVRRKYPDAVLSVGHLSRQGGGELDRHASHESGRDADVAFYVKDARGKPVYADHFVTFAADGTARTWPGAVFDDARNWALVSALLSDPLSHVSHLFVSTPLRARLLAYAARAGAPAELQTRAAITMVQPHGALPHDDHFHVRISCPANMPGCVENPTIARKPKPKARGAAKATPHAAPAPTKTPAATKAPPAVRPPPAHADTSVDDEGRGAEDDSAAPAVLMTAPIDDVDGN